MANQPVYTISYSQGSEEIKKVNCFNAKERNETLKLIKNSARIMHPLPHVEEIDLPIKIEKEDKRVAYFRQSENGLYIRMALLKHIIK